VKSISACIKATLNSCTRPFPLALSRYIFSLVPSRRVAPSCRRLGAYLPPFRPPTSLPLLPPVYSALCATASGARLPLPTAPLGNNDRILLCYIILPGPAAVNCMRGHPHHLASYVCFFTTRVTMANGKRTPLTFPMIGNMCMHDYVAMVSVRNNFLCTIANLTNTTHMPLLSKFNIRGIQPVGSCQRPQVGRPTNQTAHIYPTIQTRLSRTSRRVHSVTLRLSERTWHMSSFLKGRAR
jgi:hypothetical protein